jgi:hypothetical protein
MLMSFISVLLFVCRKYRDTTLYLHRLASQKLSFETLYEVYFLYSMSCVETNEVIQVDTAVFQRFAGKIENDDLKSLLMKLEDQGVSNSSDLHMVTRHTTTDQSVQSYTEKLAEFKEYAVNTYGINRGRRAL